MLVRSESIDYGRNEGVHNLSLLDWEITMFCSGVVVACQFEEGRHFK